MSNKEKIIAKINHLVNVGFKVKLGYEYHSTNKEEVYRIDKIKCIRYEPTVDKSSKYYMASSVGGLEIVGMVTPPMEYQEQVEICEFIIGIYKQQLLDKMKKEQEDVLGYLDFREENYLDKR